MNNFTPRKKLQLDPIKYDEHYLNVTVKQVVKKTGEGEDDYVLVDKNIVEKVNIDKLINSQVSEVGVYNLLDKINITGDSSLMPKEWNQEGVVDYTQMPGDLMEAVAVANTAGDIYKGLPDELKGEDIEKTLANLTEDQIKAYIASLKGKYQTNNSQTEKKEGNE